MRLSRFSRRSFRDSEELIDDCGKCDRTGRGQREVVSGDRREPFCEVELELKSGKIASLCKLGAVLAERYPLTVERKSKYARGLLLPGSESTGRKTQAEIPAGGTVREVMGEILIGKIQEVFSLVEQFLAEPGEPESAHKCRVRIRQMRALLSFAKPALNRQPYDHIQDRLRALADKFSYIREST
jgi:inorganic triphosphatase YgiF